MSEETYRVTLRNRGITLEVGSDEPIFDACEKAGVDVPIACKYGGCITCAAKLIEGRVRQPGATAINKRQNAEGYILLCVARPRTDCVIDVGVESHDKLYANPFAKPSNTEIVLRAQGRSQTEPPDLGADPVKCPEQ